MVGSWGVLGVVICSYFYCPLSIKAFFPRELVYNYVVVWFL